MKDTRVTVTLPEKFLAMCVDTARSRMMYIFFHSNYQKISNDREDISNNLDTNFLEVTLHQAPFIFVI